MNFLDLRFVLNTSVASPHELSVTDFTMRPALDLQAVSTSVDGRFKLWSLVDDTDIYRTWDATFYFIGQNSKLQASGNAGLVRVLDSTVTAPLPKPLTQAMAPF